MYGLASDSECIKEFQQMLADAGHAVLARQLQRALEVDTRYQFETLNATSCKHWMATTEIDGVPIRTIWRRFLDRRRQAARRARAAGSSASIRIDARLKARLARAKQPGETWDALLERLLARGR